MGSTLKRHGMAAQPPRNARRGTLLLPGLVCLLGLAMVSPGGAVVILLGTLPSFVVLIVDGSADRSQSGAVAGMNLAGTLPFLPPLLALGGHGGGHGAALAVDPYALLGMYAAAACGWMLYTALPAVFESAIIVAEQRRRAQLRDAQERLIHEWGTDVAPPHRGGD